MARQFPRKVNASVDWSDEEIRDYVRQRLREARRQRGVTQNEIASVLGKTRVAISDIERGRINISVTDLSKLARYFGLPINQFFPPYNSLKGRLIEPEQMLLLEFRQLPRVDQHIILEQARERRRLIERAAQSMAADETDEDAE